MLYLSKKQQHVKKEKKIQERKSMAQRNRVSNFAKKTSNRMFHALDAIVLILFRASYIAGWTRPMEVEYSRSLLKASL